MTTPPDRDALRGMLAKATPGPWRWEINRKSKTVEICGGPAKGGFGRFDLTVIDFVRWGMNRAAPRFWSWSNEGRWLGRPERADVYAKAVVGREHHADWFADIDHPDAQIIVTAVNALPALLDDVDRLTAENARLREALEPFKNVADYYDFCDEHPKGCPDTAPVGEMVDISVGQLRAARAALTKDAPQ